MGRKKPESKSACRKKQAKSLWRTAPAILQSPAGSAAVCTAKAGECEAQFMHETAQRIPPSRGGVIPASVKLSLQQPSRGANIPAYLKQSSTQLTQERRRSTNSPKDLRRLSLRASGEELRVALGEPCSPCLVAFQSRLEGHIGAGKKDENTNTGLKVLLRTMG